MAKKTRKIHVPAYAPGVVGVHVVVQRGVEWEVVKTMGMVEVAE